jgi:3-keto-L-gulonate-6-phosphate decarboxylase
MWFQATVDAPTIFEARRLLYDYEKVPEIDYVEIGAPMLTHYGVDVIKSFTDYIPVAKLYADIKCIDFPEMEMTPYMDRGITRMSAMAVMNYQAFVELARLKDRYGLTILVSLMGFPISYLRDKISDLHSLGFFNFICHGAGVRPPDAFHNMMQYLVVVNEIKKKIPELKIIAAGGIDRHNAPILAYNYKVDGLIVGRGIAKDGNIRDAVQQIRNCF